MKAHEQLQAVFKSMDADGDEALTLDELKSLHGNNRYVAAMDTSHDGLVSMDEFLMFAREILKDRGARALDGYIKNCIRAIPKDIYRRVALEHECRVVFAAMDRDDSGTMDRDEIRHLDKRGQFFNKLDCDGDGSVTVDEFIKYVLEMSTERGGDKVQRFLAHVRTHCEARIKPDNDDLVSSMSVLQRPDFIEQYKHPRAYACG